MATASRGSRGQVLSPVLLVFFLLLPGCITGGQEAPQPNVALPPLGLGLEIPDELPGLAPFLENPHDIAVLEAFLLEEGAKMLEECEFPEAIETVQALLGAEQHYFAIRDFVRECGMFVLYQNEEFARVAMVGGRELEVRNRLHMEADEAVATFLEALDAHPGPGNAVEAVILERLAIAQRGLLNRISGAVNAWAYYENGTDRSLLGLQNTYLGLLSARVDAETMTKILDRYPWTGVPCVAPDWDVLIDRVDAKFDEAIALGWMHIADPEEAQTHLDWHGGLLQWHLPNYEAYKEHGWWWAILVSEVYAEMTIAYWENRTQAEALPTVPEAQYLLAKRLNESRDLWSFAEFRQYYWFFQNDFLVSIRDWHGNLIDGTLGFMATLTARWPYADLDCPGTA